MRWNAFGVIVSALRCESNVFGKCLGEIQIKCRCYNWKRAIDFLRWIRASCRASRPLSRFNICELYKCILLLPADSENIIDICVLFLICIDSTHTNRANQKKPKCLRHAQVFFGIWIKSNGKRLINNSFLLLALCPICPDFSNAFACLPLFVQWITHFKPNI